MSCLCSFDELWSTVAHASVFLLHSCSLTASHFAVSPQAINPCLQKICHPRAHCTYLGPNRHSCTCQEGYRGDGRVCLPVDPCQTNFGNCPTKSTVCKYDGPGQVSKWCRELKPLEVWQATMCHRYHLSSMPCQFSLSMFRLVFPSQTVLHVLRAWNRCPLTQSIL